MTWKLKLDDTRKTILTGAVLGGLAGVAFLLFQFLANQTWSYNLLFLFRPTVQINDVVIVYMDDESHRKLGQPWFQAWDRNLHTQFIRKMTECNARAVVLDILFDESKSNDVQLAQAMQENGKVIVGAKMEPMQVGGQIMMWKPTRPVDAISQVARWGLAETDYQDCIYTKHYQGEPSLPDVPTLAWKVAELTMTNPPVEHEGERWMNFYGEPGIIPSYSFVDVLSNQVQSAAFSNKVVYVGALAFTKFTGGKNTDDFRTPYTMWTHTKAPGAEINATTYLNLLRRDWLQRVSPVGEFILVLVCGFIVGGTLVTFQPIRAALLGLGIAVFLAVVSIGFTWWRHVWFDWFAISGAGVPVAVMWSVLANTRRLGREKAVLEGDLHEAEQRAMLKQVLESPTKPTSISQLDRTPVVPFEPSLSIPDHKLVKEIGRGGYGEVWLAQDIIGSYHAVKIVHRGNHDTFEREFKGIQKFTPISRSHPGFMNILHVGRNDTRGYFYYIMELGDDEVQGTLIDPMTYSPKNLAKELQRRRQFPVRECIHLGLDLVSALDYLHRQHLIHRDIKPANIIFVKGSPKFADIGLVTDIRTTAENVTYIGTEGYIAPEGPGSPSADIFSLGKVLYEASMGLDRNEFPEFPKTQNHPEKQDALKLAPILLKACQNERHQRYQSAAEMSVDLYALWQELNPSK